MGKEEFLLLLHAEENSEWPNFPYWKYTSFGLISVYKNIYHSHVSYFWTFRYHHHVVSWTETLYIILMWLVYPCRYSEMISRFGRFVPDVSLIFDQMTIFSCARFGHLFSSLDHNWFFQKTLMTLDVICNGHNCAHIFFICWFQEKALKFIWDQLKKRMSSQPDNKIATWI